MMIISCLPNSKTGTASLQHQFRAAKLSFFIENNMRVRENVQTNFNSPKFAFAYAADRAETFGRQYVRDLTKNERNVSAEWKVLLTFANKYE